VATHDYVIANGTGAAVRSDLNGALAAIVSQNSSASEPATMYAYMLWADTTAGIMKMRNGANSAWISLWELDGTFIATDISLSAGTAGAPSLYFTGDTNTGIYSPGADQVAISTGGTGRLFVDASGRVGVGTASPDANLTIGGLTNTGGQSVDAINVNRTDGLRLFGVKWDVTSNEVRFSGNSKNYVFRNGSSEAETARITSAGLVGIGNSIPGSFSAAANQLVVGSGSGANGVTIFGSASNIFFSDSTASPSVGFIQYEHITDALRFGTNDATRLYIDSSGRVGIGTTSPSYLLDLQGSGAVSARVLSSGSDALLRLTNTTASTGREFYISSTNSGNLIFVDNTSGGQRMALDSSGRLLVGTSTSRAVEDFTGNGPESLIQIEATNSNAIMSIISAGTADAGRAGTLSLGRHRNATVGGTPTIVQSGDTIGAICFAGGDGTDMLTKGAAIACQVDGTPGANDMPGRLVFSTTADGASSPTERMRINSAGQVLISCTSFPSATVKGVGWADNSGTGYFYVSAVNTTGSSAHLQFINPNGVVGSIQTSASATSYNTSSDYRLKENVVPLTGAADRVNQLQVCRFNFIADPDTTVDGFIAHEAQAVVPECITGTKDEVDDEGNPVYQGIDQSKLVPLLTAALQEAIGRIETLEAKVAALESA
jgi:hypothetical protein